jgi:hypothetical protein
MSGKPDRIFASPELNLVLPCKGLTPGNAQAINRLFLFQIDDHPLRMQRIAFSCKFLSKVRTAFPKRIGIAIHQHGITALCTAIARDAAAWQHIAIGIADFITKSCVTCEVVFAARIAPTAFGIPIPCLDREFCILTISDRPPSRRCYLIQNFFGKGLVDSDHRNVVHASAQCFQWNNMVKSVLRSDIDVHRLPLKHTYAANEYTGQTGEDRLGHRGIAFGFLRTDCRPKS